MRAVHQRGAWQWEPPWRDDLAAALPSLALNNLKYKNETGSIKNCQFKRLDLLWRQKVSSILPQRDGHYLWNWCLPRADKSILWCCRDKECSVLQSHHSGRFVLIYLSASLVISYHHRVSRSCRLLASDRFLQRGFGTTSRISRRQGAMLYPGASRWSSFRMACYQLCAKFCQRSG